MFMRGFFVRKTKKLLVFENKFPHALLYKNCTGCAIRESHIAVLVAICKSQLAMHKKSFEKASHNNADEIDPQVPTEVSGLKPLTLG
jgi:hypothetical protein